ncbi:MAG: MaoC family dehydratase N-terminal domain-containing protein [Leptospiraceae bacterium]|nr:MaoC family dehydratase N-terminal domain-containing protein [Leptospiraceae bacterium]
MSELSKEIVGQKLPPFKFDVERGKVAEFCTAIGETNPVYTNIEEAKKAGYDDTPIPLTFQTTFTFWGYTEFWNDLGKMGIDIQKLLHMKEEYTYHKPIYPGTTVTCSLEVTDVKTGKMNMVTFGGSFSDKDGNPFITSQMAIVIRPD